MSLLFPLLIIGVGIGAGALILSKDDGTIPIKEVSKTTFYCYRCHYNHNVGHDHFVYSTMTHKTAKKSRVEVEEPLKISDLEV